MRIQSEDEVTSTSQDDTESEFEGDSEISLVRAFFDSFQRLVLRRFH